MYSPDINCLFIHIPKVAGNSIMQALGTPWEDHKDITRYLEELGPEELDRLFKFAIVRNPWERVLSEYNFQKKKSQRKNTVRLFLHRSDDSVRGFSDWVRYALKNPDAHHAKEWGGKISDEVHRMSPQTDWISLDGKLAVDFVGRMETLQEDFDRVCDSLDIPRRKLKRRNRKFHWHYSRYYDDETRDLVGDYYAKDLENFGYQFERGIIG